MHDLASEANRLDPVVVESPEMLGKTCMSCQKILAYNFFQRDSSYKDGRRDQCQQCESSPRLSTLEHTHRLQELNYYSEAVKKQRWDHQQEYKNDEARIGKAMHHSEFIYRLNQAAPGKFTIRDGKVVGDLALYEMGGTPREDWGGLTYRYLMFFPEGTIPEYSLYEFDQLRDIPRKEFRRGWRTVLLRLINAKLLTEQQCEKHFGLAEGPASFIWKYKLHQMRNAAGKSE